jgi:hypothetical protein
VLRVDSATWLLVTILLLSCHRRYSQLLLLSSPHLSHHPHDISVDCVGIVVLGKSVNRLNGIPSGLSDSIGQVANAQRAYLAQIGIRLSFRRRRSQYNNVKLERHTRSPLWTLKCSNADYHCVVFVEEKLQVMVA